jgi:hypothetical protein
MAGQFGNRRKGFRKISMRGYIKGNIQQDADGRRQSAPDRAGVKRKMEGDAAPRQKDGSFVATNRFSHRGTLMIRRDTDALYIFTTPGSQAPWAPSTAKRPLQGGDPTWRSSIERQRQSSK